MKVFFQAHVRLHSFAATVKPHHEAYAASHGIDYRMIEGSTVLHPWWVKIEVLNDLLPTLSEGAQIVYADLDSVIRKSKFDVDIFDFFQQESFDFSALLVGDPQFNLVNMGVLFCRNTAELRALISDVVAKRPPNSFDEPEITKRLNAPHTFTYVPLPPKYNSWNDHKDPDPIIVSFHGDPDRELHVLAETL